MLWKAEAMTTDNTTPVAYVRREPTTDRMLLQLAPYRAEQTNDSVIYRDPGCTEELARVPWYMTQPKGSMNINDVTYTLKEV